MLNLLMKACGVTIPIVFPDEEPADDDLEGGVSFDVSSIILDWARHKSDSGEIHLIEDKCGKKYVRFITNAMSNVLSDTDEASSRWNTKNHYFYEIVNLHNRKIYMKLTLSGVGLSTELRDVCNRINEIYPSKFDGDSWQKRTVFSTERIGLETTTTKDDIRGLLAPSDFSHARARRF